MRPSSASLSCNAWIPASPPTAWGAALVRAVAWNAARGASTFFATGDRARLLAVGRLRAAGGACFFTLGFRRALAFLAAFLGTRFLMVLLAALRAAVLASLLAALCVVFFFALPFALAMVHRIALLKVAAGTRLASSC